MQMDQLSDNVSNNDKVYTLILHLTSSSLDPVDFF